MKKIFIVFLFYLFAVVTYSQNYKYAWISDLHIGAPQADSDLRMVVNDINKRADIKFVVATGDIAEKGENPELELAKQILDSLRVSYQIIPGNHDTKWSESGCTKFKELWLDDKFQFEFQNVLHIGLNSGIPWRGGGGHISVEQIAWLKNLLTSVSKDQEIILYVHHPLDGDVDNWFEVTNLLVNHNIKAIFIGHGHSNRLMNFANIPSAMGRSTLARPKYAGYTLVELKKDSISLYEIKVDSIPKFWGSLNRKNRISVTQNDSLKFIKYSKQVDILWQQALNKSVSTSLLTSDDKIFSSTIDGTLSCFGLNGKLVWKNDLAKTIFSRPAISNGMLFVGTIEGELLSINPKNGEIIQTIGIDEPITSQLVLVDAEYYGEKITAVIAGTASGKIFCYEIKNLELVWENNSAAGMVETLPLVVQDKIIFGSWDNYLYCLSKSTGSLIWKWTENKNFYYSPAACWPVTDGKNVFVSTPDKHVSAIDLALGTTTWRNDNFSSWESSGISDNHKTIFLKSIQDKFYLINSSDGKLKKEIKIGYSLDTMPIQISEWNGNIIFGSKNGIVYLIDKSLNAQQLFFMGTARIHSIQHVKDNVFAASNMDGNLVVFKLNTGVK